MIKPYQRIILLGLGLIAAFFAAKGVAPDKSVMVPAGASVGLTLFRVGLVYLAYLCALLAIDLSPDPDQPSDLPHTR